MFTGVTAERLGITRICLGLGLLPFHYSQLAKLLSLELDGPHYFFLERIWYLQWLGIERLDPTTAVAAFGVLMLATLMFALGCFTRSSVIAMLLCILYLKGARDSVAGDLHHRYLIPFHILIFFAFSDAGKTLSIDAVRRARKGLTSRLEEWQASWPIKSGQIYCCLFYFGSGVAKLRASGLDWARDGALLQETLLFKSLRSGVDDAGEPLRNQLTYWFATQTGICEFLGYATFAFELGFPLILLVRSTRLRILFFAGVTGFHIANYYLMSVKFQFLPLIFVIFFDLTWLSAWGRSRLERLRPHTA